MRRVDDDVAASNLEPAVSDDESDDDTDHAFSITHDSDEGGKRRAVVAREGFVVKWWDKG